MFYKYIDKDSTRLDQSEPVFFSQVGAAKKPGPKHCAGNIRSDKSTSKYFIPTMQCFYIGIEVMRNRGPVTGGVLFHKIFFGWSSNFQRIIMSNCSGNLLTLRPVEMTVWRETLR